MTLEKYDHRKVDERWQKEWLATGAYTAVDFDTREKAYVLVEFPYPSGEGLHVGHCLSYIAQDIIARVKRMQGMNVLYPIGWDAFGLPTENFAIKNKMKPQDTTKKNIANFKRQIQSLGISFDWSREVNTTDPGYYKWTQWIFLQLFKKGLAEKKEVPINWCPKDKIGLAFEEVIDGKCERCGTQTERRNIKQWVLKITQYADRLIDDLDTVDYLPEIKQQQINWIGRSEGAEIDFAVSGKSEKIKVFTTRPDTLFGATYLVLSPEHPLIDGLKDSVSNWKDVQNYIGSAKKKTERERQESKEKTGVELKGVRAVNPANNEEIPIWIADYVLSGYGTGAIMAVPGEDERDREFADEFDLPIRYVTCVNHDVECNAPAAWEGVNHLVNSGRFTGMYPDEACDEIIKLADGKKKTFYKLRDWIFSRQHYWGEPIPIIICEKDGYVPLDEKDLPLQLPDVEYYEPTDTGESPLAKISEWVNVKCPKCGSAAKRETDTMPNWAGSSWYFLRYTDPKNNKALADTKKLKYWLPVDLYNGGSEHTTLHLLYSRFWHKFLYDIKAVSTPEPYQRRVQHGMILGPDGQKMSKSRGNVINPDETVAKYGADVFRMYMMFMGEYDQVKVWSDNNLQGVARFIKRLWEFLNAVSIVSDSTPEEMTLMHRTIQRISTDMERRSFNTIISHCMVFLNEIHSRKSIGRYIMEEYMRLLAPVAPHFTEEVWHTVLGHNASIHNEPWPEFDEQYGKNVSITVAVQVNGKVRGQIMVMSDMSEDEIRIKAIAEPGVAKHVEGKSVKKFMYVKDKIVSIVV